MQTIQIQLPDQLARNVEEAVREGAFASTEDVILASLRSFIMQGRFRLQEEQQLRDVEWARKQHHAKP
ncbi:hypothetical protein Ga0100231_002245 [Opitutaceae bacterium TAV4]|uniref:hypothetical protein n=1 Tax=Geminisphaera colitermitum TaxID=1148786 RepID=UPI0001965317|nr:hypothetical protein [Geminisphaera colitermitum]RRJ97387.1 hypothetical protein Ga0100231_002245 [Opitutaceae bacterium TAV4]RRK01779.1 hypothetical protein Ga0100230_000435 [Opitutaceae bacterium TAV3]